MIQVNMASQVLSMYMLYILTLRIVEMCGHNSHLFSHVKQSTCALILDNWWIRSELTICQHSCGIVFHADDDDHTWAEWTTSACHTFLAFAKVATEGDVPPSSHLPKPESPLQSGVSYEQCLQAGLSTICDSTSILHFKYNICNACR